jgi:hypothetical protein
MKKIVGSGSTVRGMDPRIRIHTKMSWIRNTVKNIRLGNSKLLSRWDIKWVDDTHALGVFSTPEVAAEALALR